MDSEESPRLCIYCGWPNPEPRTICSQCRAPLVSPEEIAQATDEFLAAAEPPEISRLDLNSQIDNGFSYPDWAALWPQVTQRFPKDRWWDVYCELSRQWLLLLKEDLGGNYRCHETENFLLLCAEGAAPSHTLLNYADSAAAFLEKEAGPILKRKVHGKCVLLAFSDPDDYYAYVSHFHLDGEHALSGGMMISGGGYMHIAFPLTRVSMAKSVLTHELVHNCIAHLRVPTWLHEGLAQKLEHRAGSKRFALDRELADEHLAHWNEQTIQQFWSGASFYGPDEGNKLSYSLAEILTNLLSDDWKSFLQFVLHADYRDAGQDAALQILDRNLGDAVGEFLGPGNWRPQRKIIAEHHNKRARGQPERLDSFPVRA
jgi:hypothetical protein